MNTLIRILTSLLVMGTMILPAAAMGDSLAGRFTLAGQDITLTDLADGARVGIADGISIAPAGSPDLPVVSVQYLLPHGSRVKNVIVSDRDRVLLAEDVSPLPRQIDLSSSSLHGGQPALDQEQFQLLMARDPVVVANQGNMRGQPIVTLWIRPLEFSTETGDLFYYSSIDYELVLEPDPDGGVVPSRPLSRAMHEHLASTVRNPGLLDSRFDRDEATLGSDVPSTYPVLIITNNTMYSPFLDYAEYKQQKGTWTAITTTEWIQGNVSGSTLAEKIRNHIADVYTNDGCEYVILGGDIDVIPTVDVVTSIDTSEYFDGLIATDRYYGCLDNNWNENGNDLFGEIAFAGDTVDYYPEVYVGRLPVNTCSEAQAMVAKLMSYETNSTYTDYQTQAFFTSAHFHNDQSWPILDEFYNLSQGLQAFMPAGFTITQQYEASNADCIAAFNAGRGFFSNYSHSACGAECFLSYHGTYPGNRQRVLYSDLDTLSNANRYGFFLNSTCGNNNLDHTNDQGDTVCVGRSFILNPGGGGIGYLGSTIYNYSSLMAPFHQEFVDNVMGEEMTIGEALETAKMMLIPEVGWIETVQRNSLHSYLLLGDPSMQLWTATPQQLDIVSYPSSLERGRESFSVIVKCNNVGIPGVRVCMWKDGEIFVTETTNDFGVATFLEINLPSTGYASLVAGRHNYFPDQKSVLIVDPPPPPPPPSCPVLYVFDGEEYVQENPLLTACERSNYTQTVDDYYLIGTVPGLDQGAVRCQIREMEDEISFVENLELLAVPIPEGAGIGVTGGGEVFAYESMLKPSSAVDDEGNDHLEELLEADQLYFESTTPGGLIVRFPRPDGDANVFLGAAKKELCIPEEEKEVLKGATGVELPQSLPVGVEYLASDGLWRELFYLTPRTHMVTDFFSADGLDLHESADEILIRINWEDAYMTDQVGLVVASEKTPDYRTLTASDPIVTTGRETDNIWRGFSLDGTLELRKGDVLDCRFNLEASEIEASEYAFIVHATGRYKPDYSVYTAMIPGEFQLYDAYPNPFNPSTAIQFDLPRATHIDLSVFNVLGQKVKTLYSGQRTAGHHEVEWRGTDESGRSVASGVYFYRLQTSDFIDSRKMVLMK